ncbi:Oidioi.mRNA.OKI2018_I69.chr1.g1763.t1.cds [Oikopleura dioica]|uniref:Sulfotransferase n=1 Tax=Oikopleura dioica TaxID=34765 RepID=A0ABN7SQK6_OIKDI|nr:Oidioi.mRNA.OKI2018_I69.chr1.g1763.t1.cds [Oikopleura dioica]
MKSSIFFSVACFSVEANVRCGDIRFGDPGQFGPVSLTSYPGSGNTWVRYLIEEFTGYYTGSVYHDGKLFKGGFKGEIEDWSEGRVVITKSHTYRPKENALADAIMLIRNPYDCFLSEFNRVISGADHTGKAETKDFMSERWVKNEFEKYAGRWYRLYANLINSGYDTLPIIYEDMKADPQKEMEKVVNFLDVRTDYESKYECLFGENSQRFKRSSGRDVDPYLFVNEEHLKPVNEAINNLSALLKKTHG